MFEMPAGFTIIQRKMQNAVPVVDDHEGTNGEGHVGVKWEGQVVYERKFQRI